METILGRGLRTLRKRTVGAAFVALVALSPNFARAQEHPEHPKTEAPSRMTPGKPADAITTYIEEDADLEGGRFLLYDGVDEKTLALGLQKVHGDKPATLGNGVYFACTDRKAPGRHGVRHRLLPEADRPRHRDDGHRRAQEGRRSALPMEGRERRPEEGLRLIRPPASARNAGVKRTARRGSGEWAVKESNLQPTD